MMTEEQLAELERRAQRASLRGVHVDLYPETLQALIADIRYVTKVLDDNTAVLVDFGKEVSRQREEIAQRDAAIAALRYTLEGIRGEAMSMRGAGMDASNMGYSAILITTLAENALSETANTPAPEIKVGDRVRVTSGMHEGETGVVTVKGIHTVTIVVDGGKYYGHSISDVERID